MEILAPSFIRVMVGSFVPWDRWHGLLLHVSPSLLIQFQITSQSNPERLIIASFLSLFDRSNRLLPWCQSNSSILTTSSYITIQPLLAVVLDYFLLGENVSWSILVGGVFILVGLVTVAMAQYKEQKEEALKQFHAQAHDSIPLEEFGSITHVCTEENEKQKEREEEREISNR